MMKNLRMGALLVFMVFACRVPAQAQVWEYWNRAGSNDTRVEVYIIINQLSNGYEVRGWHKTGPVGEYRCALSGSYFPRTGRLRATCAYSDGFKFDINGLKRPGKDLLQVNTMRGQLVLRRVLRKGRDYRQGPGSRFIRKH